MALELPWGYFKSGMRTSNVGSKGHYEFWNVIGIWTKFCVAMRTFIAARKSPIAVFRRGEVYIFHHATSLRPNEQD
jgi:hypothetical protein